MANIDKVSATKFQDLFHSISSIFINIDGNLQKNDYFPILVDYFREKMYNKNLFFITNNCRDAIAELLLETHLKDIIKSSNEILTPIVNFVNFLNKIHFNEDIYVIASNASKNFLKKSGFNIIEYEDIVGNDSLELDVGNFKNLLNLTTKVLEKTKNVKMIYFDFDINISYGKLQVAQILLNKIDFSNYWFCGYYQEYFLTDKTDEKLIANKFWIDALERWTKKKAKIIKPFDEEDLKKCLILTDQLNSDETGNINIMFKTSSENINIVAENLQEIFNKLNE